MLVVVLLVAVPASLATRLKGRVTEAGSDVKQWLYLSKASREYLGSEGAGSLWDSDIFNAMWRKAIYAVVFLLCVTRRLHFLQEPAFFLWLCVVGM